MPSIPLSTPPTPPYPYTDLSLCHSLLSSPIPHSRAKTHCSCFGSAPSRSTSSSWTTMSSLLFSALLVNKENSPKQEGGGGVVQRVKKCIKPILPGAHWPGFGWCFSTVCGGGFTFINFSKWPPTSLITQTTDSMARSWNIGLFNGENVAENITKGPKS